MPDVDLDVDSDLIIKNVGMLFQSPTDIRAESVGIVSINSFVRAPADE